MLIEAYALFNEGKVFKELPIRPTKKDQWVIMLYKVMQLEAKHQWNPADATLLGDECDEGDAEPEPESEAEYESESESEDDIKLDALILDDTVEEYKEEDSVVAPPRRSKRQQTKRVQMNL